MTTPCIGCGVGRGACGVKTLTHAPRLTLHASRPVRRGAWGVKALTDAPRLTLHASRPRWQLWHHVLTPAIRTNPMTELHRLVRQVLLDLLPVVLIRPYLTTVRTDG